MNELKYKRIYETPVEADGFPILLKSMMSLNRDTDRNCPRTQHQRSLKIYVCRSCKIIT